MVKKFMVVSVFRRKEKKFAVEEERYMVVCGLNDPLYYTLSTSFTGNKYKKNQQEN